MYDLKDWFLLPSTAEANRVVIAGVSVLYGRETHHLEGINTFNKTKTYAYHFDTGKNLVFVKTPNGFPMDVKTYDNQFIYDTATELDWTSPSNYKKMTNPIPMCPRYWDGDETIFIFSKDAPYGFYKNCQLTGTDDVSPAYYTLRGPFDMDFLGHVGVQPCIRLNYYWKDKKHLEKLYLTRKFGWVRWEHSVLTQLSPNIQEYVPDSASVHNMLSLGQLPKFNFPCFQL